MDRYDEYFKFFYEDLRSDFGDTPYTEDFAHDLAIEQVQADLRYENACQEAWQDDLVAYRADRETPTISDNKLANKPPEMSGVSGGVAISALGALGSPATIFVLGLGLLSVGVYVLYKLSSDDAQTSSDETTSNAQTERMNRLEALSQKTADTSDQTDEILAKSAENINKLSKTVDTFMKESSSQRLDEHNGKFGVLDKALADHGKLVNAIQDDVKARRRQPGGMLYTGK